MQYFRYTLEYHSTKLNINLKKIAEHFLLSGRAYSQEQHSSVNGFAEALLLPADENRKRKKEDRKREEKRRKP